MSTADLPPGSGIGGLYHCAGWLDILKFDELNWFIVFHTSIWGCLELCLGGLSSPKPPIPVATGLVHCDSPTANSSTLMLKLQKLLRWALQLQYLLLWVIETYSQQHISLSKQTLLWPSNTCVNSEQELPPLHVWNHFFVIDTVPQIARYCRHRICPFWVNRPFV